MDSPWKILGLEPAEADEKSVKRAYARLLKTHRPESDPERFQILHQAYQVARDYVKYPDSIREAEAPAEPFVPPVESEDVEPPFQPPAKPVLPESFRIAMEELLEAGREHVPLRVFNVGRAFCEEAVKHPSYMDVWGETLMTAVQDRPDRLAEIVSFNDMLLELEMDHAHVTEAVIEYWQAQDRFKDLMAFAAAMLQAPDRLATYKAGCMAVKLARILCVYKWAVAKNLLDFAYPLVPSEQRPYLIDSLGYNLAIGTELKLMEPKYKVAMTRILNGETELDLSDQAHVDLVNQVQIQAPIKGATYCFLHDLEPEVKALWPVPTYDNKGPNRWSMTANDGFKWYHFVFLLILIRVVIFSLNFFHNPNRNKDISVDRIEINGERIKGEKMSTEELLRKLRAIKEKRKDAGASTNRPNP